ncbi:hypothetical protein FSP39_012559, partial [Pinctada imbricata]
FSKDHYITRGSQEIFAYPTLLDIAGLEDEDSFVIQEMLRVVLFGRIQEGDSLQTLHLLISENVKNIDAVREWYLTEAEEHRVDRIIFIASANADTNIPTKLINVLCNAANSPELVIPRYGVLTHCDKVDVEDEAFLRKEKDFKAHLGLPDNRYMRCRNYCDDIDRIYGTNRLEENIPEIDIPVIKFMTQVCHPGFVTPKTNAKYHKCDERTLRARIWDNLKIATDAVIPRYGVLTHCDLVDVEDEAFLRKERDFKARLGLPDNRYMRCRNYCDDIDRIYGTNRLEETIPEIDIPVIKFMTQVSPQS